MCHTAAMFILLKEIRKTLETVKNTLMLPSSLQDDLFPFSVTALHYFLEANPIIITLLELQRVFKIYQKVEDGMQVRAKQEYEVCTLYLWHPR